MHQLRPADPVRLDAAFLRAWPLPVDDGGDKYSRGTVLVIGGSPSTPGAAMLAAVAALRMGAGRLQIATASTVCTAVAVAVPEAMVVPLDVLPSGAFSAVRNAALDDAIAGADAIVVGPGMMPDHTVADVIENLLLTASPTALLVLDAVALTTFSAIDANLRESVADQLLMTPNRQEARSLAGDKAGRLDAAEQLGEAAASTGAVLTSFGSVVAPDGRRWVAPASHPGLGTSGSGDVLAGLVAGAAARCGDRLQAACWATFAHVAAGQRLGQRIGELGYLARELVDEVPACLLSC